MADAVLSLFRSQLQLGSSSGRSEEAWRKRPPGYGGTRLESRCLPHGHDVYEVVGAMPADQAALVRDEVDERYDRHEYTDRGASLSTKDVFVRDLSNRDLVYRAIDACCHTIEKLFSTLVMYKKDEAFVIVYDADLQSGLEKHRDGTSKNQRHTLLIVLDGLDDYLGGGTRFFPDKPEETCALLSSRKSAPFTVRPSRGGAVIFPPGLMHEGLPITRGRRHVVAVFTKDGSRASVHEKLKLRKAQYEAALAFDLDAIKDSVTKRSPTRQAWRDTV